VLLRLATRKLQLRAITYGDHPRSSCLERIFQCLAVPQATSEVVGNTGYESSEKARDNEIHVSTQQTGRKGLSGNLANISRENHPRPAPMMKAQ